MSLINDQSILMSIKKLLNVDEADDAFDTDIGMLINAEFMTLHQLGIGPANGFFIQEADTIWAEFSDDRTLIEAVKTYIYMKVRMIFDPPASSVVAEAFNSRIRELEFRLNTQAERYNDDLVRTDYKGHDVYPDSDGSADSGQNQDSGTEESGEPDASDGSDDSGDSNGTGLNGSTLDLNELIYGGSGASGSSGTGTNTNSDPGTTGGNGAIGTDSNH